MISFIQVIAIMVLANSGIAFAGDFVCKDSGVLGLDPEILTEIGDECGNLPEGPCRFSCEAGVLGLVDENGLPVEDLYNDWVDEEMPEEHREKAKAHYHECFENNPIDPEDLTCEGMGNFNKCTWELQPSLTC